ncbi:carboxypeptidase S1 [Lactarius tabidus]
MWAFMQAFYAHFSDYRNHDFAIVTESYGGHYGPKFAAYFESQNAGIEQGTVSGITIPLIALAINNGLIDPNKQFKALIKYAANNPYRNVINGSEATALYKFYDDSCGPALHNCSSSDTNKACADAANICFTLFDNITKHDFDLYDIRQEFYYSFPPATYVYYLQDSNIQSRIGARVPFQNCSGQVYDEFVHSGDYARSFINSLSEVVQAGIQTVIWAGDADWICNTIGVQEVITDIRFDQSTEFNAAPLKPFTINGVQHGTFKAAGNLSFLIVPGAGHQVAAFKPKTALEVFRQTINKEVLHST